MASMSMFGMRSWSSVTLPEASSTFWTVPLTRGVLATGLAGDAGAGDGDAGWAEPPAWAWRSNGPWPDGVWFGCGR